MKTKKKFYCVIILFQLLLVLLVSISVNGFITYAVAQTDSANSYNPGIAMMLAISAAMAVGLSVIGSAIAIKSVGTAAISSLLEREESFFKAFLIVALCEALAVYGLIISILLWTKIPSP